jgi:hypothetical protein
MNRRNTPSIPPFLAALVILGWLAGCATDEQGAMSTQAGQSGDGVETRGLQGAPPQAPQLPTWPQRFEVRGPETAAFGFAVTQPGSIVVDVQWQGPPLRVALEGPSRLEQTGAGRVVLKAQVTPQAVQQGASLWSVSIALQNPGPAPAVGQISVQHPQVNEAVARRAAEARRHSVTQQQLDQAHAQTEARLKQAIASRKAQFAQDLERRDRAERDKIQPMLTQLRASRQPSVRPRGLEAERGNASTQSTQTEEISTRGAESLGTSQTAGRIAAIVREQSKLSVVSAPAYQGPPHISSLSETSGGPKKVLRITGMGFSDVLGQVYFTVPPDRALPANIAAWTAEEIIVELPDVTGVLPYQANIYVARGQDLSNRVAFNFIPRQQLRDIRIVTDDRRHSFHILTFAISNPPQFMHIRNFIPLGEFFGDKGNDEYFLRTQLKNGWTVSGDELFVSPLALPFFVGPAGGAYIQERGSGANPYLSVRWWINPFAPYFTYRYVIHIVGPEGVPDGIVVP